MNLTNSMQQRPFEKLIVPEKNFQCFMKPKILSIPNSPPLVPILGYMNPVHSLQYYFNIHFNIIIASTSRPSKGSLSFSFLCQNPMPFFSPESFLVTVFSMLLNYPSRRFKCRPHV